MSFKITTPHAAIIVWNYNDRLSSDTSLAANINSVDKKIISTVSCLSIQTQKSKSSPQGTFQVVLAPTKNWVSTLTAGSWCCLLMSNDPITEEDIDKANSKKVKMFGKIESVRCEIVMSEDGSRQTLYYVSGVDWGHIFNNIIYIDNAIGSGKDGQTTSSGIALAIWEMLLGANNLPKSLTTPGNLKSLINLFGKSINFQQQGAGINRLGTAIYDFVIPEAVSKYFGFTYQADKKTVKPSSSIKINNILSLIYGKLDATDTYSFTSESAGYINPYSLQGTNTFWQILLENSNPAMNELITDFRWTSSGPQLCLYNRIKPFSYKNYNPNQSAKSGLRSYFQYLKTHELDNLRIKSINAGTNWRDKYNFVEIKPEFQDFAIFDAWLKQLSQDSDRQAFLREGFRPLIVSTKQWPGTISASKDNMVPLEVPNFNALRDWARLLKEWHTDTHRMLNGTLTLYGVDDYIAIGDNIKFSASLFTPSNNYNTSNTPLDEQYILAHVENISHTFGVSPDGGRTFFTTIEFVRGINVTADNKLVGEGTLDKFAIDMPDEVEDNSLNVISTEEDQDG